MDALRKLHHNHSLLPKHNSGSEGSDSANSCPGLFATTSLGELQVALHSFWQGEFPWWLSRRPDIGDMNCMIVTDTLISFLSGCVSRPGSSL
jgi:hypothetical protein